LVLQLKDNLFSTFMLDLALSRRGSHSAFVLYVLNFSLEDKTNMNLWHPEVKNLKLIG